MRFRAVEKDALIELVRSEISSLELVIRNHDVDEITWLASVRKHSLLSDALSKLAG